MSNFNRFQTAGYERRTRGEGVPEDYVQAYAWYSVVAALREKGGAFAEVSKGWRGNIKKDDVPPADR